VAQEVVGQVPALLLLLLLLLQLLVV